MSIRTARISGILASIIVLATCIPAFAQLCAGRPPLSNTPIQVGAGLASSVKSRAISLRAAAGGPVVFGSGLYKHRRHTGKLAKDAAEIRARLGLKLNSARDDELQLCPIAEFSHRSFSGRDWGHGGGSITGLAGGVLVGQVLVEVGAVRVVPTLELVAGIGWDTSRIGGVGHGLDGLGRFGVGFIVGRWLSVHPTLTILTASDIPEPAVGVTAIVGIGI